MAAKKRAAFLAALVALFASTSALASIPRHEIFAPAIERFAFENAPPARPELVGALPLVDHLRSAADAAWPIESLPKTRVWDFEFVEPLVPQPEPQLSRALRQGYERLERGRASGDEYQDSSNLYAFCGGDPINCSDPTGEFGWNDVKTHAAVTWGSLKGVGRSVVKTVVGTAAGVKLIAEASDPLNIQAKLQLAQAAVDTKEAVAGWGTSAGYAIAEPELISEALNELTPEEIGEEMFDAAVITSAFVTPLEGVGAEAKIAQTAARARGVNLVQPKPIQPRPANVRFGPPRGGGGNALARQYAYQVTNGAEKAIYVNGVEFEGIQQGILVDAKRASGVGSFYDISAADRFTKTVKLPKVIQQARRQLGAVQGGGFKGIRWEIADAGVAQQLRQLFVRENIRITVVHNPALR